MKNDETTALTTRPPADVLASAGFMKVRTIRLGEGPGKQLAYVGELLGPGAPIDLAPDDDGVTTSIPTWTANPATDVAATNIDRSVVDTIVSPVRLHAFFRSVWAAAQATGKRPIVFVFWTGLVQLPGQAKLMNDYDPHYRLD